MNDKIKLLAEQARVTFITTKGMEHIVDGCYVIPPDRLEKFGELIVRECISELSDTFDMTIEEGNHLKEHFGVKE